MGHCNPIRARIISGCWVQHSNATNQDGYFRKTYGNSRKSNREAIMFHRLMWMHDNNQEIPDGFDIDHICCNRGCFNPEHLRLFKHGEHQADSNKRRYRVNGKLRLGSRYN